MWSKERQNNPWKAQTHCKKGHELSIQNTSLVKETANKKAYRLCKTCKNARLRDWRNKLKPQTN